MTAPSSLIGFVLLISVCSTAAAQSIDKDSVRAARASQPVAAPEDSIATSALTDTVAYEAKTALTPEIRLRKDSLTRTEYHDITEMLRVQTGIMHYTLGVYGAPGWASLAGTGPQQFEVLQNQHHYSDRITGQPAIQYMTLEDANEIVIYPQHSAFYHGGNGRLLTVQAIDSAWNVERPLTRLRHLIGPYQHLWTDVFFTMNPGESDNLLAGITRQSYGLNAGNRFLNSANEGWNIRATYRKKIDEHISYSISNLFNDYTVQYNGGIAGWYSEGTGYHYYPDPGAAMFPDTGFSAILAELINPRIGTEVTRNTLSGDLQWDWFANGALISRATVSYTNDSYSVLDEGQLFLDERQATNDSLAFKRDWSDLRMQFDQGLSLGWAALDLGAAFSLVSISDNQGHLPNETDVLTMLRGKLAFFVNPFTLSFQGRYENGYGQNTVGLSGTLSTELTEDFMLWGGAGITTRPYSPLELRYGSPYTTVAGSRDFDLERTFILEGGARVQQDWAIIDARVFLRRITKGAYIYGSIYENDSLHSRFATTFENASYDIDAVGISAWMKFSWWHLNLELNGSASTLSVSEDAYDLPVFPDLLAGASFYIRANRNLISTLDLKAGVSAKFNTAFFPYMYIPETRTYAALPPGTPGSNQIDAYTERFTVDGFIYATIQEAATLHVILKNALDTDYITSAFYPMLGTSVHLGVDWIFFE